MSHEVIGAHPGFVSVSRWELVEPAPPGGQGGPRWLAVYEMADEAAALQPQRQCAALAASQAVFTLASGPQKS